MMELIVADQTKNKRISFNSGVKEIENKQCNLLVPTSSLIPSNKWLNLQIDCSSFLEASSSSSASSGNRFKSLEAIIISAPCRIRRIFTSKSLLGTKKPQGDHAEEVPKIFSFPADVESENVLISLSSVSEVFREKHSQMADTFNSKFGDSLGQLESPMNSTLGMNIPFQKNQSNQSETDKLKVKKNPCEPIQEHPAKQQHRGSNRNPRDLSSPNTTSEKMPKQGINKNINKYPLPHPSSSSSSSHAKHQFGGYLGRNTISQEDDCKEFQTTAVSDLRGSVNTMNSGKQRVAMSPPDVSSSYSSNQLQNASSNTFNSTAASKGQRVNSRLGKHTPLSTQKSNNYNRLNEQSKSPKTTNSGTTTTTTSAAKSNPWSTNISKASKANYISAGGMSESSDSIPGGKSLTNLTPERTKQYRVNEEAQKVPGVKPREVNRQSVPKQKYQLQKSEKTNTSSIKKPGVSQEAHTPPPRKHEKTEGNRRQLSVSRNQITDTEYFEMSQKFSTLGDPRLFQIEHIIEEKNTTKSSENQKIQIQKSKAQAPQSQANKKPAGAVGAPKIFKNHPQNDRKGVQSKMISNANKVPQNQKDNNFKEEDEQIEEVIETESKLADGARDDWEQCRRDEDFDHKHLAGTQNKTLKNVGSGYFHSAESQESCNDDKRLTFNNNEGLMANGINQNSTGLSFTKPNLIVKRKESGATDFHRTGQHHYQHMKSSREESEENDRIKNKTDGFINNQQQNRNYKSDTKQRDQVFKQQLPDIDEQTIPDTDTLKQTQTNFFKEQMNIFTADMRPFTPPFNQVGKVVSASNQSTVSMSKKAKEMDQSDHQIEVIYDDVLNCYYDPKTNQYFDLKS